MTLDKMNTQQLAELLFKFNAIIAGLEATVWFKLTYKYTISEMLMENQGSTAEWGAISRWPQRAG
jgi:hypothetical protein